jgi:glyoxylase-like metal-dependent hydrolase (beta-lactamase superfamily II)/rhodanese-related sulfurtransferase
VVIRPLFDSTSSTHTYLVFDADAREAVLIDPVYERHERDAALIRELGLRLVYTLDTHCHADHVTGAWLLKRAHGSAIALAAACRAENVDRPLQHGDDVKIGDLVLQVRATPGHTDGCLSFVSADQRFVFTGDALLVRGAGRTDFQSGDSRRLFRSIREQLFTLPDECVVYPAHDYEGRGSSTIAEERRFNPRIGGGAREEDFVGYMQNLALPHPKQLDVAVPANLRCGRPEHDEAPALAAWAPLVRTYAGIEEVPPEWVAGHRAQVHVLDVRAAVELSGDLGRLKDAQHIPLDELRARIGEVPRDKPVVTLCQTGRRSALATTILARAGVTPTANIAGGMATWRLIGLPS